MDLELMKTRTPKTEKLTKQAFIVGIIGLAIAAIGLIKGVTGHESRLVASWLLGFSVWFSIGIGILFIIMIWYLFDAGWPVIIRRQLEHAISIFPILGLVLLPLILIAWFSSDPGILWKWVDKDYILPGGHGTVGEDPLYLHKEGYLNLKFFTIRAILYFGVFTYLAWVFRRNSFCMDNTPNPRYVASGRIHSALGVFAVAFSATYAAIDFFMSISYHWFSTMYGVWFFATSMRAGLAVTAIICAILGTRGHLKGIINRGHMYNLGCMFLAFTVFWAYISFCQYFLIYNANIPEETFWYNMREINALTGDKSSWWWISLFCLIFGYFFIPFLILLFYKTKVIMKRMVFISIWILVFHLFDLYFNIVPKQVTADNVVGFVVKQFSINLWDVAAIVGVGGLCVWCFLKSMQKTAPIPLNDPRIKESLKYHE